MQVTARSLPWFVIVMTFAVALPCDARAQAVMSYPTKPVRFVVVTAHGGGLDVVGRIVADRRLRHWGKSPEDFDAMLKADYQATAKLAARIGLKVD